MTYHVLIEVRKEYEVIVEADSESAAYSAATALVRCEGDAIPHAIVDISPVEAELV